MQILSDKIDKSLVDRINQLLNTKSRVVIAIDGNSSAGKSSLAALLKESGSCSVISMDHFFLKPEHRSSDRLSQPGGNIDHDRFIKQVITPLKSGEAFAYHPYDCKSDMLSDPVFVDSNPLIVVEGAYSLHPMFCAVGIYDISVFLEIDEAEQKRRLMERDPNLYERFINEWVPMENMYFDNFKIKEKCDFLIHTIFPS